MQYSCPADTILDICAPSGCKSCQFLEESIDYMLSNSLDKMPQFGYDFLICVWDPAQFRCSSLPGEIMINRTKDSCLGSNQGYESKQQPIPTDVGKRTAQMYICQPGIRSVLI
jgi:hypothetical protein